MNCFCVVKEDKGRQHVMNHPFYSSNPQSDPSDTLLSSQVRSELCLGRCGRVLCWELRIAMIRAEMLSGADRTGLEFGVMILVVGELMLLLLLQ